MSDKYVWMGEVMDIIQVILSLGMAYVIIHGISDWGSMF
jgi:hypothetical protein